MSEQVARRIRDAIADHGPITFAEFMQLALYGPGGFYERPPVGERGHFVTSPHVHPVFADLLRMALVQLREALGEPDPFPIVELGAGDATLARQLIASFAEVEGIALDYAAVEISSGARSELTRAGIRASERIADLRAPEAACVVANELLDNLAFRRVRSGAAGPVEVRVGLRDGALVEIETPWEGDPGELPSVPIGTFDGVSHVEGETLVPVAAEALLAEIAAWALDRAVYVLLIDYGFEPGPGAVEVHGYRDHRVLADVLADPGDADITAGVDFERLGRVAGSLGLRPLGTVTQRDALHALGFREWDERQLRRQVDSLDARVAREAIDAWQSRTRAALLVDPNGLGRLRWLLLATPGLPAPTWLERAVARGRTR